MRWGWISGLALALGLSGCGTDAEVTETMPTLNGEAPIIIAHRGASGERPEHTLEAYELAIEQGADFIEPDLVLTKDGILIARHENEISETTDVADRPEFADRKTSKTIDGREYEGWFTEDFTLAELKTLFARERLPQLRESNTAHDGKFRVPTFEEILELLKQHEAETGNRIGVYPETKHPSYFAGIDLPHDGPLLKLLTRYGYDGPEDPVFIQSFEVDNLKLLKLNTKVRLVQLVASESGPPDQPDTSYADMVSAEGLADIALYASGIGPSKDMVISRDSLGRLDADTGLVAAAHKAGLEVHPWTFRRENYFLPTDMKGGINPAGTGYLEEEVLRFIAVGVDGLFSDNVTEAVTARNQAGAE
ncbi:MAG: glycerophosphodiester phosphodiesterase [Pseudomonadota bacterium]